MTDVTGFGLLGHLLEICRGSKLRAEIAFDAVPVLSAALHLVKLGFATGASDRNWSSVANQVALPPGMPEVAEETVMRSANQRRPAGGVQSRQRARRAGDIQAEGFDRACEIGRLVAGPAGVTVR